MASRRPKTAAALWGAIATAGLTGCAPATGWQRESARVCAADSPAVVCVQATPDRAVEFEIGGVALVPGECGRAPASRTPRALRVAWRDTEGKTHEQRIRAAPHKRTELALRADGALDVIAKTVCDSTMPPWGPPR